MTFQTLRYITRKRLLWKSDDSLRNPRPRSWNLTSLTHSRSTGHVSSGGNVSSLYSGTMGSNQARNTDYLDCNFRAFHWSSKQTTERSDHCHFLTTDVSGFDCLQWHYISWTDWSNPALRSFSIPFNDYRGLVLGRKATETWDRAFTSIYCQGWERVELFLNSPTLRYGVQPYFLRLPYTTFPLAG